jgi:hypothetical protein
LLDTLHVTYEISNFRALRIFRGFRYASNDSGTKGRFQGLRPVECLSIQSELIFNCINLINEALIIRQLASFESLRKHLKLCPQNIWSHQFAWKVSSNVLTLARNAFLEKCQKIFLEANVEGFELWPDIPCARVELLTS